MGLWVRTLVLGLGFFGISTVWPLYDFYMPLYYGEFIKSGLLVGAIMAIDNVLGLTLQPYFGALSDRTRTRFGRRIPYLLVGAPLGALFLATIPWARSAGLLALLAATIALNLAMAVFRSPTVALMPDLVPSEKRSQANGIINFMGGLGAGVPLLIGGALYALNPSYPFLLSAGMLLAVALIFWRWIREPAGAAATTSETPHALRDAARSLLRIRDRQSQLMMLAIVLWSMAYQAANAWFSTYATRTLGMTEKVASQTLFTFALTIVLLAIPCGFLGGWLGRRRSMALGALIMAVGMLGIWASAGRIPLQVPLFIAGTGWSLIVVNAYPAMVQMAGPAETGTYTGLYYIASQVGAIIAPPLTGLVKDLAGWGAFFIVAAGLLVAAALAILQVWRVDPALTGTRDLDKANA